MTRFAARLRSGHSRVGALMRTAIRHYIVPVIRRSPRLSSLYYGVSSPVFRLEHQAVYAAKWMQSDKREQPVVELARLRRNIHRLEKALISPLPRNVFAQDYIGETLAVYARLTQSGGESATLTWARDVLARYFEVVERTRTIEKAFQRFQNISSKEQGSHEVPQVPYRRSEGIKSNVTYDEFLSLCRQRRAVRYYRQERVPHSLLRMAVDAAAQSPSSCNRQPFRFVVVDEADLLKQVAALPLGTASFADNMVMLVVVIGDLSADLSEAARHTIYVDASLAAMSFMLALETLGLSSCPINWADVPDRVQRLNASLSLSVTERCILFISVGYALEEGMIPFSQKKSFESLVEINPRPSA